MFLGPEGPGSSEPRPLAAVQYPALSVCTAFLGGHRNAYAVHSLDVLSSTQQICSFQSAWRARHGMPLLLPIGLAIQPAPSFATRSAFCTLFRTLSTESQAQFRGLEWQIPAPRPVISCFTGLLFF